MKYRYHVVAYDKDTDKRGTLDAFNGLDDAIKLAEGLKTYLVVGKLFTEDGGTYDTLTVVDKETDAIVWSSEE